MKYRLCMACGKSLPLNEDGTFPDHDVVFVYDDMEEKDGDLTVFPPVPCKTGGQLATERNSL